MIAGTYDDMQGGICYGGIAHAGPVRYQRAAWFNGDDYILIPDNTGILGSNNFVWAADVMALTKSDFTLFSASDRDRGAK